MLDGVVVQVMDEVKKAWLEKLGMVTDLIIGPERVTETTSLLPNQ